MHTWWPSLMASCGEVKVTPRPLISVMKASSAVLAAAAPAVATASPTAAAPMAVVTAAVMRGENIVVILCWWVRPWTCSASGRILDGFSTTSWRRLSNDYTRVIA